MIFNSCALLLKSKRKTFPCSPKDYSAIGSQTQVEGNSYIYFSDAAWNSVSCAGGLGWTCSDPDGSKLFQGSASEVIASVLVAEAM